MSGGPVFDDYEERQHELDGLSKYETFKKVLTASGRREPYMSGNLTTNLSYKNIRLSGTFAYSLGAKVRLFQMYRSELIAPESNLRRELLDRWQNPGDEKHMNLTILLTMNIGRKLLITMCNPLLPVYGTCTIIRTYEWLVAIT